MAYIGVSPSNGVRQKHTYTATASQTTFSGAGSEGVSLSYRDSNYVDVYRNGVKLGDADYTATSGTSVVLGEGAAVSDIIEIVTYDVFSVADTVSKADGGTFDGNVSFADNTKAIFGDGDDLEIYHDGSHSYIKDVGSGDLIIQASDDLLLESTSGENYINCNNDGSVEVFYDGGKKLETTSTGIDVTGNITFGDSHTIGDDGSDNLEIATSVGENLILASSGNVNTFLDTNEDQSTAAFQIHSGTTSSTHKLLRVEETGDISFYEDTGTTAKFFWDASEERLGIGTTSPIAPLHVKGTTNGNLYVRAASLADNTLTGTALSSVNDAASATVPLALEGSEFNFVQSNAVKVKVDTSGNVGIGESNPVAKTHIQGSGTSGQTTASLILENSSSGTAGVDITGSAGSSRLRFLYGGGPSTGTNTLTEAMNIVLEGSNAGNVGIGTDSPTSTLEVIGGQLRVANSSASSMFLVNPSSTYADGVDLQATYNGGGSFGPMKFSTSGSERMRITSNGSVGIGTVPNSGMTSLTALQIGYGGGFQSHASTTNSIYVLVNAYYDGSWKYKNAGVATEYKAISGEHVWSNAPSGSADGALSWTGRMKLTDDGHLLLRSEATNRIELGNDGTSGTNSCNFIRGNNDTIDLNTGGGNYTFEVNGAVKVQFDPDGDVRNQTNVYSTISDERMKENIVDANSQWDDIKALRIRNFNLIGDDLTQIGVIAQELESAGMNGLVKEGVWKDEIANPNNELRKNVKTSIIYMKAVKALQEAITRIETLETANTALEARILALENA